MKIFIIIVLIFAIITLYFGQQTGNDAKTEYANCLSDGNTPESCNHLLEERKP